MHNFIPPHPTDTAAWNSQLPSQEVLSHFSTGSPQHNLAVSFLLHMKLLKKTSHASMHRMRGRGMHPIFHWHRSGSLRIFICNIELHLQFILLCILWGQWKEQNPLTVEVGILGVYQWPTSGQFSLWCLYLEGEHWHTPCFTWNTIEGSSAPV